MTTARVRVRPAVLMMMRVSVVTLGLAMTAASVLFSLQNAQAQVVHAQEVNVDSLRAPFAHSAFFVAPYKRTDDRPSPRFWTRSMIALVSLDGAAKAADSYITRRNIAGGGLEFNPLARPFVHTTGVQVVSTGALFGLEIAAAYMLHRRRHLNLARGVLVGGALMNGLGAASSFQDRVADW